MQQLLLILHVLIAVAIIILVLMQHGRGADVGASFGSGSSNTMFGSSGALPFLMKLTVGLAAAFFITSIALSYLAVKTTSDAQIIKMPAIPAAPIAPTNNSSDDLGASFAPTVPTDKK